jgi:UDP-2,3-diacylglucosamine hydrolase
VAHYFSSDVHLRFDCPDRDRRFRAWLDGVAPDDDLVLLGDLCDFWMGARCSAKELLRSESLQALAAFRRRGGSLAIMPGNHDAWLCPFYERELGARIIEEPHDLTIYGLRLRLVHGHLLGARRRWKSWMESRPFFDIFGRVPGPIAQALDRALTWRNHRGLFAEEERHLRVFRAYAAGCRASADLVVIGHVHRPVDEAQTNPRLIVLGGWQVHSSFLRIDEQGAQFHVQHDRGHSPVFFTPELEKPLHLGARLDEN